MLNFAGENLTYTFLKNILRTLDTPQTDKELKVKMKKINLKHNIHLYFLKIKKKHVALVY